MVEHRHRHHASGCGHHAAQCAHGPVCDGGKRAQINLAWTASTDNVGVTGYLVERCQGAGCSTFAQIATPAGTSFSDTGLAVSTSYSYRVRASDAAGNLGAYSAVASATTSSTPLGLVAAYAFNEGAGSTVADVSGNGNTGTIGGATWTTVGKFGNALVFNGTGAQVTVPNAASLQLTTGMTLEAWVFPTATPTGWRAVVDKNVDGYYLMASTDQGNRPAAGGTWTTGNQNTIGPSVLAVEHLDAPGGDLRRGDGAAVRERGAGGEPGADRAAGEHQRDAANRRGQLPG